MSLKIYNTLTRQKEDFHPCSENRVNMYVCGVTLYDELHLGHARAAVIFDLIRRYLEYKGYQVRYVTNFTDVDDKMIQRANELNVSVFDLARKFIDEYFRQIEKLNIKKAHSYPRATEHIEDIIAIVRKLEKKGIAYSRDGNVFFRVRKFPGYGKLSGQSLEKLFSGARVEVDEKKEDPFDFALWKKAKKGEPSWDSPWGRGRPGWHIECSAMAMSYLGESIDIHGGGEDLVFPHHENEIAQSESATGKRFSRFWIHNGLVTVNDQKMAKSTGNFITLSQALEEYSGEVIRYYLLSAHYRSPLNYTRSSFQEARSSLHRVYNVLERIEEIPEIENALPEEPEEVREIVGKFFQAMDDDFNTPGAFAAIFELVRKVNSIMENPLDDSSRQMLLTIGKKIRELGTILGLFQRKKENKVNIRTEQMIELLIEVRDQLRKEKKWRLADYIRDKLAHLGIQLEDKKDGTVWRVNPGQFPENNYTI